MTGPHRTTPIFSRTLAYINRLIGVLLLSLFGYQAAAQSYGVIPYLEGDGLPSNIIADVEQDSLGLLWILTDRGLIKYDGTAMYPLHDSIALPTSWGSYLEALPDGRMIALGMGESAFRICLLNLDKVEPVALDAPLSHVRQLPRHASVQSHVQHVPDGQTRLLFVVGHTGHEYNLHSKAWSHFDLPEGEAREFTYLDGHLTVFSSTGAYQWLQNAWQQFSPEGVEPTEVLRWVPLPNTTDGVWIGRDWVALRKHGQVAERWPLSDDVVTKNPDWELGKNGELYFTGTNYFYQFTTNQPFLTRFSTNHPDAIANSSRLHLDQENNLWIGTYRGIFKINSFRFANYTQKLGLANVEATAITQLPNGTMVIGSSDGYTLLRNNELDPHPLTEHQRNGVRQRSRINVIAKHPKRNIWTVAAGWHGLGTLYPNGEITFRNYPEITSPIACAWQGDTLWVSNSKGVYGLYNDEIIARDVSLAVYTRKIVPLPTGKLALITTMGLFIGQPQDWELYTLDDSPDLTSLYDLEIVEGRYLFASDRGLLEWDGHQLVPSSFRGYEQGRPIFDLLVSSQGHVWLGTDDGVFILKKRQAPIHYSRQDGLVGSEINRNSLFEDTRGHIWVGTNGGVSVYVPERDPDNRLVPITQMVYIREQNNNLPVDQDIDLPSDQNTLEFRYRGISYYNEEMVNYRVRLHGFDQDWRSFSHTGTSVLYTNLPGGDTYQLEVQARVGTGEWSDSAFSGNIHILQPFYARAWFVVLILVVAVSLGFLIRAWVTTQRDRRWLEQQVDQKTEELRFRQQELRSQNQKLVKINEELDRFVYSASHDLSAPLKSISGLLNIAKLDQNAPPEQRMEYLNRMERSVGQLNKFIRELIDFSRNSRLESKPEQIDLAELVPDLLGNLQFMEFFDRVDFQLDWGEEAQIIVADEFRLKVILNNLLSNAVKFQRLEIAQPQVRVSSRKEGSHWSIAVSDNGQGIEPEYQKSVFEMFFRANEMASGSGLGLYIAHEAATRMGGALTLASTPGKGATFTISLPLYKVSKERKPQAAKQGSVKPHSPA